MVDDHFGEGMGYLLLFIGFFLVVFGSIELTVIWFLIRRTTSCLLHRGIPVLLLLLGYLLLMGFDASLVIFGSLLLVAPMAALIPPLVNPRLIDPASGPDRILVCYLLISVFTAVLLFAFGLSDLAMAPEVWRHTPVSNAIIFAGVLILDTLAAFCIYGIMQAVRPALPENGEKPA